MILPATLKELVHVAVEGAVLAVLGWVTKTVHGIYRRLGRVEVVVRLNTMATPDPTKMPPESPTNPGIKLSDLKKGGA